MTMEANHKEQSAASKQMPDTVDNADSHRKSWQSKYQSICQEYSSRVEETKKSPDADSHQSKSKNPLIGLLSEYNSDSDSEEAENTAVHKSEGPAPPPSAPKKKLNDELSFFLQEIQTISSEDKTSEMATMPAPAENMGSAVPQAEVTHRAAPGGMQHFEDQVPYMDAPMTSWQECYDESSGYVYYWNVETNEVSWEMPAAYQYYFLQHQQWMQQTQMPMILPEYGVLPNTQTPAVIEAPAVLKRPMTQKKLIPVEQHKKNLKRRKKKKHAKTKPGDSDEERIEMITSYGPPSGDESDESMPDKKKKRHHQPGFSAVHLPIFPQATVGPQPLVKPQKLPPKENHLSKQHPQSISACIAALQHKEDLPPDGGDAPVKVEAHAESQTAVASHKNSSTTHLEDNQKEITKLNSVPSTSANTEAFNCIGETVEGNPEQLSSHAETELSVVKECTSLSSLHNKMEVAESSAGEVAATENLSGDNQNAKENVDSEDKIISENQTEQTTNNRDELVSDDTLNNSMKENVQKTGSFAMIAGYGEDSDIEEDKKENVPKESKEEEKSTVDTDQSHDVMITDSVATTNSCPTETISETDSSDQKNEVSVLKPAEPSVTVSESNNNLSSDVPVSTAAVTEIRMNRTIPSYRSSLDNSGRRGLGFEPSESDTENYQSDSPVQQRTSISVQNVFQNHGNMINFVKAETLVPSTHTQDLENTKEEEEDDEEEEEEIEEEEAEKSSTVQEEKEGNGITGQIADMSGVIMEKVTFLAEGKEAVSAVQTIGIQVQTLLSAWEHGSLCENYFSQWLANTMEELSRLEQDAAPDGWQCLWSRCSLWWL